MEQQQGKIFVADYENKVLVEKLSETAIRFFENAMPKTHPATWLTEDMDRREFVEGKDFILQDECSCPFGREVECVKNKKHDLQNRCQKASPLPASSSIEGQKEELEDLKSFLLGKAKELNIYVDFSDKSYDGDKSSPMDLIGFLDFICGQAYQNINSTISKEDDQ